MWGLSLFGVFVLAKLVAVAGGPVAWSAWSPVAYFWQDALIASLFGVIEYRVASRRWVAGAYWAVVVYTVVNVLVVRELATPLTGRMLAAARGALANSIVHHATVSNGLLAATLLATAAVLPGLSRRIPRSAIRRAAVASLVLVLAGLLGAPAVQTRGLHRNALVALFAVPSVPRAGPRSSAADWRQSPIAPDELSASERLDRYYNVAAGRNVVIVVLESTAAQYLRPYGAADDPMPHLSQFAAESLIFDTTYAVYPESIKGLIATLFATNPGFGTKADADADRVPASLASVLRSAGYRSGLFHSGRFMYLGMDAVVARAGFDTAEDAGDIGGNHESSFGVDEFSTVQRVLAWIDSAPRERPFFVTYMPIAGHHPYDSPSDGPYPTRDEFGRYRNALSYADSAFERLWAGLHERGLVDETLFVVFGDHGEAFDQHPGNRGHTFFLYDENVRVPLLIAAPGAIEHGRVNRVSSLIDIAPTVADLLGLEPPGAWTGQSLLGSRHRLALFFADYSLPFLGLRDGPWKFIHQVDSGHSELYRTDADPGEQHDVAGQFETRAAAYREHVRNWCATQLGH